MFTLAVAPVAWAAEDMMVSLSCVPKDAADQKTEKSNAPTLVSGQPTVFSCTAKNVNMDKSVTLLVLGKETKDKMMPVTSSADLSLPVGASGEVTMQFPAIFQPGSYEYVFSVYDTETKALVSKEVVLSGVLKGAEQPAILSVIPDKDRYEWGAPFLFSLSLAMPKGEEFVPETLSVTATLQDMHGQSCLTLIDHQTLVKAEDLYQTIFPETAPCTNVLEVTLTDKDGTLLDKKLLAIGLPEAKMAKNKTSATFAPSTLVSLFPRSLMIGLSVTGVLVLALIGYFLVKKNQKRRF